MARFNWGGPRGMDKVIHMVRKLARDYDIQYDDVRPLYEMLFDAKEFLDTGAYFLLRRDSE